MAENKGITNKQIMAGLAVIAVLFFYILFGIVGVRAITGVFLVFFLPFYIILDLLNLERTEKIIFSFFLGIGIYPSIVYYLAVLLSSMRVAVLAAFVLLMVIALMSRKFKKRSAIFPSK